MFSWPLLVSFAAAAVDAVLAPLAMSGLFTGGSSSCGDFGFRCLGHALIVFGIASAIGTIATLCAFASTGARNWLNWLALLVSVGPPLALVAWIFTS